MEPVRTGRNMRYSWDDYRKAVVVQVVGSSGAVLNTDLMGVDDYRLLRSALDAAFGIDQERKKK